MASVFFKLMTKITAKLDPCLERYRPAPQQPEPLMPGSKAELIELLQCCDQSVLSTTERELIAGAMSLPVLPVKKLMHSTDEAVYLRAKDTLNPHMLDKLYKSEQRYFFVRDRRKQIIGALRADDLEALDAVEKSVSEFMMRDFCYARADYSYQMLLNAFLRANCNLAIIVNRENEMVGYATLSDLIQELLGDSSFESFTEDKDRSAVAKRSEK